MLFINTYPLYDFLASREEEPERADAIFVLGAGSMGPVKKAAKLWSEACADYVAFISKGGNFGGNLLFGTTEAEAYAKTLEELGVPAELILHPAVEEMTTNTLMEAQAAIPFLSRTMEVGRVVLVSRPVHQRRAKATFAKQWPDIEFINCPCDEELTIEHLSRMLDELDRLRMYAEKGDILQTEFPPEILVIEAELRGALKR